MNLLESQLDAIVARVFHRLPDLVAFSIELEPELVLADVESFPWPALHEELMGEIATPLLELLDEEPAVRQLLRGRTFARALH